MHTATQLDLAGFDVEISGRPATADDLLPDWTASDRFGIVVTEPLAGVGASLLIQLATVRFFDVKASRRVRETGEYPEIYLFHFGGVHGDFGGYDFWPPRKEVVVPGDDPITLLESLNAHAISRLAVPVGAFGDRARLRTGVSSWAEEHSAEGRMVSCLAYDAHGAVPDADVVLRSAHPRAEENVDLTLDAITVAAEYVAYLETDPEANLPGVSVMSDVRHWADAIPVRYREVTPARRAEAQAVRARMLANNDGVSTESYRRRRLRAVQSELSAP